MQRPATAAARLTFSDLRELPGEQIAEMLRGPPQVAAQFLAAAAQAGIVEAQTLYGQVLLDGRGVAADPAEARIWFGSAARAGHAAAMNMLGRCHECGWGGAADPVAAAGCYASAGQAGLDWGQFNLANLLLNGLGLARDRRAALGWYIRAARQNHAKAMNMLGRFREEGWGVRADLAAAQRWYRRAAAGGDFRGQYNLATLLAGQGQTEQAALLLRHAVAAGSADFLDPALQALARIVAADGGPKPHPG